MAAGSFALTREETRVLGCLLEKQRTTPDMYPLTLNGLRLACNQSTNRDPVVDYDDAVVRDALHRLERRGFTRLASGRGSRAPKYRHLLAEAMPMGEDEQALMCVLMLRGPQTPGELKQRAERMNQFDGLETVHETLLRLIARGMVARLGRRPGQKEERYAQLLEDREGSDEELTGGPPPASGSFAPDGDRAAAASQPHAHDAPASPAWMASVEERLASLEREVKELRGTGGSSEANGSGTRPAVRE
jgi:uncharacterized protein YceH (UPF0502 family)